MPPELMELYSLYQQELQTRETNENDSHLLTEAKEILRVRCTVHSFKVLSESLELPNIKVRALKATSAFVFVKPFSPFGKCGLWNFGMRTMIFWTFSVGF